MAVGCITISGLTAMLAAQIAGTVFKPSFVRISSDVMPCTGAETFMNNIVYVAPAANVVQLAIGPNLVRTILSMDTTVGTFTIGTVGLYTASNQLFALAAFPGAGQKVANNLPTQVGNIRTLYVDTAYNDISATFAVEATDVATISITQILAQLNGAITARQLRTALANMALLAEVNSAIASAQSTNQAVIDWLTCAPVAPGGTLITFIASTTGQLDGGAAILAAAALLPA